MILEKGQGLKHVKNSSLQLQAPKLNLQAFKAY
jgi:hypothetical protein